MKVSISFPGCHRRGGVERVMLETINHLAQHGHETHAFTTDCEHRGIHPHVHVHQVETHPPFRFLTVPSFVRATRRAIGRSTIHPDVSLGFGAAAQPGDIVWMQSVHAEWLRISGQLRSARDRCLQLLNPFHPVILRLERQMLRGRRYRHVVALTEQVKQDVIRHYGVPSADISVVPNGYADSEFNLRIRRHHRTEMRNALGLDPDARVLVFVANEAERKGLVPLLHAMASLNDPRVHLLAVGRLPATRYSSLIGQLGLETRVHFTGPSQEVNKYYAASDVFVLPTQYEAWGLVIVEAMACGLPVLTSRLAGASICVREGINGWLLDDPSNEADISRRLHSLLCGEHATSEVISESVLDYRWSKVLQNLEDLMQRCLQHPSLSMAHGLRSYENSLAH